MGTTQNKYQSTLPWNTPAVKNLASNLTSAFSYKPSSGNMSGDMYILNGLKNTGSDIVDYYNRNRQAMADPAKRASAMNNLVTNGTAQRNVAVPSNATDAQAVSSGYTPQYNQYAPSQFKLTGDYGTGATGKKTGTAGTTGVTRKTTAFGGGANDKEYMDAMRTPATSQTYNPSDYSGNDWASLGSTNTAPVSAMTEFASAPSGKSLGIGGSYTNDAGNTVYGSVGDRVSDYTSGLNSDGFWSHNVGNMPEGLSDVEKAAWLQSPSTFSNILGGVGTGASALSSLYGMYMQNKNYNLQKDAYNKQVAMARASEGRMSDFAKAMGGSYRTANI